MMHFGLCSKLERFVFEFLGWLFTLEGYSTEFLTNISTMIIGTFQFPISKTVVFIYVIVRVVKRP